MVNNNMVRKKRKTEKVRNEREQVVHELHRNARKNFPRRKYVMRGINDTFQADLVEMIPLADQNEGYRYILMVIDVFSKRAWAKELMNKTGEEVTKAMASIFADYPNNIPRNMHTDQGKEFYNVKFQSLMKKHNINHYSTYSGMKASIVERLNRTILNKIWQQFSLQGSYDWLSNLRGVIDEYNTSHHRTIHMKPMEVTPKNEDTLLRTVYKHNDDPLIESNHRKKRKFNVNDFVRISKYKHIFEKGYTPNWTTEVFQIVKVLPTVPLTYHLIDSEKKQIKGCFYDYELQRVKYPDVYLVEEVLEEKGKKSLVKWLGFDDSHNSWINNENFTEDD